MNWADLTIVLPLPPSNNDLVRPALVGSAWRKKARLVSTAEAIAFRLEAVETIRRFARKHRHPELLTGPVLISAVFVVSTLASDCNNRWKALEDAITASGVVWDDDKQVSRSLADKDFTVGGARPSCSVRIQPRDHHEHARRLAEAATRKGRQSTPKRTINVTPNWRPAP